MQSCFPHIYIYIHTHTHTMHAHTRINSQFCEPQCWRFCPFVGILPSPAIGQTTLNSIMLFLSEGEVECFHGLWKRLSFNHIKYFMLPKSVWLLLKKKKQNKTNAFGFMLSDVTLLFIIQCHTLTWILMIIWILMAPVNNECWDSTVYIYTTHMAKKHAHVININL